MFVDSNINFDPSLVYEDVSGAVSKIHLSGRLYSEIMNNPSIYINKNRLLEECLIRLKLNGKKLFMITNSPFQFVDCGMNYLMETSVNYGYSSWRDLFDIIITEAQKPTFFTSNRPFRKINPNSGALAWEKVEYLKRGEIYVQGNVQVTKKKLLRK